MCGCRHFCFFEIFFEHFWKVSHSVFQCSIVILLFNLVCFGVNRASFLVRVRHFALVLDLKMYVTSPVPVHFQNFSVIWSKMNGETFSKCRWSENCTLWNSNLSLPLECPHLAPVPWFWLSLQIHHSSKFPGAGKLSVILLPFL